MSKKKYFISYYRGFSNTYNLYWTDCEEMEKKLPSNAERISRKEAIHLCAVENQRRKCDKSFTFYADTAIYPSDFDGYIEDSKKHRKNGYIWEKK